MRKFVFLVALLLWSLCLNANMAAPWRDGDLPASPMISEYVTILHEQIVITPDTDLRTTHFDVVYHIEALKEGKQIPLLFYASHYRDNFKVWVDGKEIPLQEVPANYADLDGDNTLSDFSNLYHHLNEEVKTREDNTTTIKLSDLKFFEVNLSKGKHSIRVVYVASAWSDLRKWVAESRFNYALSPARYWKSFGSLEVILDNSKINSPFETNLGIPKINNPNGISRWEFKGIPVNVMEISYKPEVPPLAETLIAISPFGLMLIFSAILVLLHLYSIVLYRRSNPRGSNVVLITAGTFILPLIGLASYMYFYEIIDTIIGEAASRRHGYTFLIMVLYVVVTPVYFLIVYYFDKIFKAKEH
jgi:hypothetical protein